MFTANYKIKNWIREAKENGKNYILVSDCTVDSALAKQYRVLGYKVEYISEEGYLGTGGYKISW